MPERLLLSERSRTLRAVNRKIRTNVNRFRSKLTYTPLNNKDYGTLMCTAANEVGRQRAPCIFHIILAGSTAV